MYFIHYIHDEHNIIVTVKSQKLLLVILQKLVDVGNVSAFVSGKLIKNITAYN